jgi:hypothetical protein
MQGVRQDGPSEVRASAPGGSDSIVSDTFAPVEKVEPSDPKFQLGIHAVLQPVSIAALATALTRIKRNMTPASASPAQGRAGKNHRRRY